MAFTLCGVIFLSKIQKISLILYILRLKHIKIVIFLSFLPLKSIKKCAVFRCKVVTFNKKIQYAIFFVITTLRKRKFVLKYYASVKSAYILRRFLHLYFFIVILLIGTLEKNYESKEKSRPRQKDDGCRA